jgi:hypothetical protein
VERHARRCAPAPWLLGGHLIDTAGTNVLMIRSCVACIVHASVVC